MSAAYPTKQGVRVYTYLGQVLHTSMLDDSCIMYCQFMMKTIALYLLAAQISEQLEMR